MFGTIHYCLELTIKEKHGEQQWKNCLKALDLSSDYTFARSILKDLDEAESIALFVGCATTLGVTPKTLFDEFGEYWCCTYAPDLYPQFYAENNSTEDFIKSLDEIHKRVTSKKPGARPPRFVYEWLADERLKVTYQSSRDLFELFDSLLKGLDKYFQSKTAIHREGDYTLILDFRPQVEKVA